MSEIDNISITYPNVIDNIDIDYISSIDNITLTLGTAFSSGGGGDVSSVNGLIGEVRLTAIDTLETLFSYGGLYFYTFIHNLNYQNPIINIFDLTNSLVYADISVIDENYVSITSNIDLTGYKVVAQR